MKTYLDCIPCFFEQALRAGRIATDDERKLKRLLDELGKRLPRISLQSTPPEIGRQVYQLVREITGNSDPFREIKRENTRQALALYPGLKARLKESDDDLLLAVKIAIAGNVIDFGPTGSFDIHSAVNEVVGKDFAICDFEAFKKSLDVSRSVLYIGDNAGECVFDRLLIERLNKETTYVVREKPVINDATYEDAVQAGIDEVATIVSSGTDAPGTIPSICSSEFKQMLDEAEFIVAKGQGNYEGLSNDNHKIFFLLKATHLCGIWKI